MTDDLITRLRAAVPSIYDCIDAADALKAKDRRIEELEKMLALSLAVDVDALKARIAELGAALKQSARVEASLASRIANLMDALEPFADFCNTNTREEDKAETVICGLGNFLRVGDLRAARAAYLGEKE